MVVNGTEVAKNNTRDSCWVVVHGQVWDVTEFLNEHPGGANLIIKCAGRDATEDYDSIHNPDLITETLSPDRCLGPVDPATLPRPQEPSTDATAKPEPAANPHLGAIINVDDFERVAERYLSPMGWAYYSSGAEDERSLHDSRRVFRKLALRPRILRDVDTVCTATTILGLPSSLPFYISPTGQAKYAHPEAETLLSRAAGEEGIVYCMPTKPSASIESIFGARANEAQPLFFQLYVDRNRDKAQATIRKAERLGARAIFVTVDSPVIGKRERDERLTVGDEPFSEAGGVAKTTASGLLNAGLTWDDLTWIRETTSLPIVIKGVQSVEDALIAHERGVDGVVLSNHGGRSQDTAQSPMVTLLEIRRYAPHLLAPETRAGFQVFVDGGIRRGTDVLKALALGATAVGIGRPFLYSMTAGYGEAGVRRLVRILRHELETNMALAGAKTVGDIVPEMVNSERAEKEVTGRVKL
ncbi:Putative FMN-dependent dehydrogenase, cytochrome b5-like heme/steroid binding protein [Colletotrichum destructivum]|uniref:FMN-dependent dehydrogenase, cytochrome b5-like heme/steroid binding protein n=1 Tax=Colletotrichum destructivum TaxID=34406 RepID=A0AAX4IH53_9PEZI|nr:Putative FMN-dependent dehydrogenase, cytochrome b5-like heme/steroid binding protein [Colletotrichum destructivum]